MMNIVIIADFKSGSPSPLKLYSANATVFKIRKLARREKILVGSIATAELKEMLKLIFVLKLLQPMEFFLTFILLFII